MNMDKIDFLVNIDQRDAAGQPVTDTELQVAVMVLEGLSGDEYDQLRGCLRADGAILSLECLMPAGMRHRFHRPLGRESYEVFTPRVESFECLLGWVAERKKGKLTYAKKKLKDNFAGYSDSQQKRILEVLLQQAPGDRRFAYRKLHACWDDELLPHVLRCWQEFGDDMCAWLMIRVFPRQKVLELFPELCAPKHFASLCRCLGSDLPVRPTPERFSSQVTIVDYLEALAHTGYVIPAEEAEELIFRIVSVLIYILAGSHGHSLISLYDENPFQDGIEFLTHRSMNRPTYNLLQIDDLEQSLGMLCKMGHTEVVRDFLDWHEGVMSDYAQLDPSAAEWDSRLAVLVNHFPERLRYYLDFSDLVELTWLNPRAHILLSPRVRMSLLRVGRVSLDNLQQPQYKDIPTPQPVEEDTFHRLSAEERQKLVSDYPALGNMFDAFAPDDVPF